MFPREENNKEQDKLEYWTGKDIDFKKLWDAYNSGKNGYIRKFHTMKMATVRLEFSLPPKGDPLFNLEANLKTLKGLYWQFKNYCLSDPHERDEAGPLFVYSIERGSSHWLLMIEAYLAPHFIEALSKAAFGCMRVYREGIKITRELEKLDYERSKRNKERKEYNKPEITTDSLEKLIKDYKLAFDNLLEGISNITLLEPDKEALTIDLEEAKEIAPKKSQGPDFPSK